MEYAVIEAFGKQHLVKPGDKVIIDGHVEDIAKAVTVLLHNATSLEIGTPQLSVSLPFKVVEHQKSNKITVFTYKSKSRYRRKKGHRQEQTVITWAKETVPAVKKQVKATKKVNPSQTTSKTATVKKTVPAKAKSTVAKKSTQK